MVLRKSRQQYNKFLFWGWLPVQVVRSDPRLPSSSRLADRGQGVESKVALHSDSGDPPMPATCRQASDQQICNSICLIFGGAAGGYYTVKI